MHIHFYYLLFLNHELRKTFRKYKAKNRAEENVWETKEFCKLRVNFFSKWGGTAVYITKDSIQILFVCVLGTDLTAKCFSSFLNTAYQDDTKPLLSKYSRELRTINWLLVLGNIFKSNQIPNFFFFLFNFLVMFWGHWGWNCCINMKLHIFIYFHYSFISTLIYYETLTLRTEPKICLFCRKLTIFFTSTAVLNTYI